MRGEEGRGEREGMEGGRSLPPRDLSDIVIELITFGRLASVKGNRMPEGGLLLSLRQKDTMVLLHESTH